MLDIKFIRENPEKVKKAAAAKQQDPKMVDELLVIDKKKRELLGKIEDLRAQRNVVAKARDIKKGKEIKKQLKKLEPELKAVEQKVNDLLIIIPNIIAEDVPEGKDESENVVLRKWGEPKKFDFKPKDHLELGVLLDVIDVKQAAKITGSRFGYLKNEAALLEFALIQYVFRTLTDEKIVKFIADKFEKGYSAKTFVPIVPPAMIKPDVYVRMARLDPSQKEERYYLPKDDIYLIGSAEHTLGPLHIDEIVPEDKFPIRYLGFSTAFRREAGTYGKDTRGILRVHQFDKAEMESFTLPENSTKEQNFIVAIQEYLMQGLEIPYQVVMICTGDMGGPNYRQVDIETWLPGQNKYRETHTSDLMTDYQARRLKTKVKRKNGELELAHMNDATAFAIGRTIIAILENYQQEDGSVVIPRVLREYVGKDKILPRR